MSNSETSSEKNSSEGLFDDGSSTWWDMGATISVAAAVASSSTTGFTDQDASLPFQELTGQWVALKLSNSKKCYKNFRLYPAAFHNLHTILVNNHGLRSTNQYESIEALGMFLWACGTRQCQRQMSEIFHRSQDTVSRKFGEVLEAMLSFAHTIIKPNDPSFSTVHPNLRHLSPYFDGCIGAIDGTQIPVSVCQTAHDDFINRKGYTSQNVMAVCDMDMRFTFVAAGKRGATHDAAVFREAVNNSAHFPHPPPGA